MKDVDTSPETDWPARLARVREIGLDSLSQATDESSLESWRVEYLGRRSMLSQAMGALGKLQPDERKTVGALANTVKRDLEEAFTDRERAIRAREVAAALERERVDISLPGRPPQLGALHPITQTIAECV